MFFSTNLQDEVFSKKNERKTRQLEAETSFMANLNRGNPP